MTKFILNCSRKEIEPTKLTISSSNTEDEIFISENGNMSERLRRSLYNKLNSTRVSISRYLWSIAGPMHKGRRF